MTCAKRVDIFKHIFFWILLGIIVGIEFAYRQPLFDRSVQLQEELQSKINTGGKIVFKALSYWGEGVPYIAVFIIVFLYDSRGRAYYYLLFLNAAWFSNNIGKMAYYQPRPFMVSDKINTVGSCSMEYGNPSGHSIFAAGFNIFFFLEICHSKYSFKTVNKILYFGFLFLAIALAVLIGYSRFYVGVHTLNQIIYGWQIGLWIAFYMHFCIRKPLYHHFEQLTEKENNSHSLRYMKYIIISTVIFVFVFMIQISAYLIVDNTFRTDPEWLLRIQSKCNFDLQHEKDLLNYISVVQSGVQGTSYGCYLGALFYKRCFGNIYPIQMRNQFWKYILRLIVLAIMVVPFGLMYLLIPWTKGLTILIIFKALVPSICGGFVAFAFSFYIYKKLRLVNPYKTTVNNEVDENKVDDNQKDYNLDDTPSQDKINYEIEMKEGKIKLDK